MAPHYQDNKIAIHKLKCGPYDNNAYLLVCPKTNESIVIDTPADPGVLIDAARSTQVKAILITHNHFDHIEGFTEVVSALGVATGIGQPDADALPKSPELPLRDGDRISAGTITLEAINTPGHTPGSTSFLVGDHVFTGDTLFPGGPGKTRTPENLSQIIASIKDRLLVLGDLPFYPGHGDDGDLKSAREEYALFASKEHPVDLCGDVLWLRS